MKNRFGRFHKYYESNSFRLVETESDVEAFYILTPAVMEKILKLEAKNPERLIICFNGNLLHVGIYGTEKTFTYLPVFEPLKAEKVNEEVEKDIKVITQFIDELNLDSNLYS